MPCFPLAGNSGRQRRPRKGLQGFYGWQQKLRFRGCSNFNLADLGVANFTANLAGYSAMYVVLCVRLARAVCDTPDKSEFSVRLWLVACNTKSVTALLTFAETKKFSIWQVVEFSVSNFSVQ